MQLKVFNRELTPDEARRLVNATSEFITAEKFAYGEQHMFNARITNEIMAEGMDYILDVFRDVLVVGELELPKGHPIKTYVEESSAKQLFYCKSAKKLSF